MKKLQEVSNTIQEKPLCPDCVKRTRCNICKDYGEKALDCTGYRPEKRRANK